jgi:hypothetical protein
MGCLGCGCLFALLSMGLTRLALLFVWLFTDYVQTAFDGWVVPLLGLIFLPFTTLAYALVWSPVGLHGIDFVWLALAFLIDMGSYLGSGYTNRGRY